MKLQVLDGGKKRQKQFVCGWCSTSFDLRDSLEAHFKASQECGNNRNTNNPTASKYVTPDTE